MPGGGIVIFVAEACFLLRVRSYTDLQRLCETVGAKCRTMRRYGPEKQSKMMTYGPEKQS